MIEKDGKKWNLMSDFSELCAKWQTLEGFKSEEDRIDELISDLVDFCKKYRNTHSHFAINTAAALFLQVDDMINGREVLGADKGALRLTAMWLEKLSREKGDKANGIG